MIDYEEFQKNVLRRKQRWFATLLNREPTEPVTGERPRELEKERISIRRSRALLRRRQDQSETHRIAGQAQEP